MSGRVILVGAGIGERSITVAGLDTLRAADAVLHDRLVPASLLGEARGDALVIDVGVRGGEAAAAGRQVRIAEQMIALAREGKLVVRLKGGDSFVFGRGGEEVSALAEAGIAVEVIPGVSAAVAAPALAGIPVTDRRAASAFTVVTGTEAPGAPPVDWRALARVGGTIVVLMGGRRAGEIAQRLIAAGLDPDTPAAAISAAGSAGQAAAFAPLAGLADAIASAGLTTPITLAIGEAVALAPEYAEHAPSPKPGAAPLAGLRVLVTRPVQRAAPLARMLREAGASPVLMPAIALLPPQDGHAAADAAAAALSAGAFDWAAFTSAAGVERFHDRLAAAALDARAFGRAEVAAIGPATAAALAKRGIRADLIAEPHTTAALAAALIDRAPARVLLARSADGDPALAQRLREAGAEVSDIAVYRAATAPADPAVLAELAAGRIDAATFTSPSTVRGLVELAGADALRSTWIACIGPVTAAAARAAGLDVHAEAERHTARGLVDALISVRADPQHLADRHPHVERHDHRDRA